MIASGNLERIENKVHRDMKWRNETPQACEERGRQTRSKQSARVLSSRLRLGSCLIATTVRLPALLRAFLISRFILVYARDTCPSRELLSVKAGVSITTRFLTSQTRTPISFSLASQTLPLKIVPFLLHTRTGEFSFIVSDCSFCGVFLEENWAVVVSDARWTLGVRHAGPSVYFAVVLRPSAPFVRPIYGAQCWICPH